MSLVVAACDELCAALSLLTEGQMPPNDRISRLAAAKEGRQLKLNNV